jgi:hypothetical protein
MTTTTTANPPAPSLPFLCYCYRLSNLSLQTSLEIIETRNGLSVFTPH